MPKKCDAVHISEDASSLDGWVRSCAAAHRAAGWVEEERHEHVELQVVTNTLLLMFKCAIKVAKDIASHVTETNRKSGGIFSQFTCVLIKVGMKMSTQDVVYVNGIAAVICIW
jgi:hypothetical protein